MDYKHYQALPAQAKLEIWEALLSHPGFKVLQGMIEDDFRNLPDVEDIDSKEEFLFKAAKVKGAMEILRKPKSLIHVISTQPKKD